MGFGLRVLGFGFGVQRLRGLGLGYRIQALGLRSRVYVEI
jgi:hypothetical protein